MRRFFGLVLFRGDGLPRGFILQADCSAPSAFYEEPNEPGVWLTGQGESRTVV